MGEHPVVNARRLKALFALGQLELRALGAVEVLFQQPNGSELARNLLASKTACLEQVDLSASNSQSEAEGWDSTSGALWVDPDTQRLKRLGPDGRTDCSQKDFFHIHPLVTEKLKDSWKAGNGTRCL
jgi:hypothetical protein